jgi:hypothetical protein
MTFSIAKYYSAVVQSIPACHPKKERKTNRHAKTTSMSIACLRELPGVQTRRLARGGLAAVA